MAIYDAGTASLAANGTVTGVGTTWQAPLTLIRVGATIVFKTEPVKIYTISEIISDTQVNVYNPNSETVPAGTGYAILAHDGITVQGLAQDVAETLRYYQSKETSIEYLIDIIKNSDIDVIDGKIQEIQQLLESAVASEASAKASSDSALEYSNISLSSSNESKSARDEAVSARDATIDAINNAGDAGTLVTLADSSGASLIGTSDGGTIQDSLTTTKDSLTATNDDLIKLKLNWAIENGYADSGFTFQSGGTLTTSDADKVVYDHLSRGWYEYNGELPVTIAAGTNPDGNSSWSVVIEPSIRKDLASNDGALMIGNFYTSTGEISARLYGIQNGVDNKVKLQELIDLSETLRIPVDFSGLSDITFSGMLRVGTWFHWKGDSKYRCVIRPLTLTRTAMGEPAYITSNGSVYAWFARKDPTVSLNFARLQHMGFDGQYQDGYSTPADRLIRAFCWHFAGASSVGRDIEAFDCYFKNCPHEAWEGYTHGGGQIDGIRYIQCVSEGTDPTLTAVGFNAFKCMNGNIDAPGAYGTYTIRNIVSKDNVATGHRTLTDLKRGCEHWVISGNLTYDMNDCHHSTDGSRYGVFRATNVGRQTGRSNTTKNYLECQGEHIVIEGLLYSGAPTGKAGQAGLFVTDYKFPSETNYHQSIDVKVLSASITNVNAAAVRLVNTVNCNVDNVTAENCNNGVSWEYVSGRTDGTTGLPEAPSGNVQGDLQTVSCQTDLVISTFAQNVLVKGEISNEHFTSRYHTGSITYTSTNKPYMVANHVYENYDRLLQNVTSTAPAKSDSPSRPLGTPYAFTLNDTNTASIQSLSVGMLKATVNSRVYLNFHILRGTSSASSVIFRELNSSGSALVNNFRATSSETVWSELSMVYAPTDPSCAAVEILLVPAASNGSGAAGTGTTSYSDIRISSSPI